MNKEFFKVKFECLNNRIIFLTIGTKNILTISTNNFYEHLTFENTSMLSL